MSDSQSPAGPTAISSPPQAPAEVGRSFRDLGLAVFQLHFNRMLANEAGTIAGAEAEALHDMRVATRRLRAAFRVFRDAFGKEMLAPFNEEARWIAALLGRVRDLDVFLEWLCAHEQRMPEPRRRGVRALIVEREAARTAERAALIAALASERYQQFKRRFADFIERPSPAAALVPGEDQAIAPADGVVTSPAPAPAPSQHEFAVVAIRRQLKRVRETKRKIAYEDQDRLHALRIACKRLRYACEFFRDLFPDRLKELIRDCVTLQDALGEMRDAHLQAEFMRGKFREHYRDVPTRMALLQVSGALRRKQRAEYATFRQAWKNFTSGKYQRQIKGELRQAAT